MGECAMERDGNSISRPSRKKPLYAHTRSSLQSYQRRPTHSRTHTYMYMCTHSYTRHKSIKRPKGCFQKAHIHTHNRHTTHPRCCHWIPPSCPGAFVIYRVCALRVKPPPRQGFYPKAGGWCPPPIYHPLDPLGPAFPPIGFLL